MNVFKKGASWCLFLFLTYITAQQANAAPSCSTNHYDETASVISVHDGDTVKLQDGRKIRLIGINTPELARGDRPEQAFAIDARNQLKHFLSISNNQVKLVYGKERLDKYRRTLSHLFLPNGQNLQVALLEQGLATLSAFPPNTAFTDCYQQVEQLARCKSLGIWSDDNYTPKNSSALETGSKGVHTISGQIERVSESEKGIRLFLQGGLMIDIRTPDLPNFDKQGLKSLAGQNVTTRGWIHPKKRSKNVKFYMRVRHPSSITPTKDYLAKC